METLVQRPARAVSRAPVGVLVVTAFLFGAVAASAVFVGVWRNEAGRARLADSEAQEAAEVISATNARLGRTEARLRVTAAQLREARVEVRSQAALLQRLGAAGRPAVADAGRLDAAARQLAGEAAGLADAVARLTNAVAAIEVYLQQTSAGQLDPAYISAQLGYLQQAASALKTRSERVRAGSGSVAGAREALAGRIAALERLLPRPKAKR